LLRAALPSAPGAVNLAPEETRPGFFNPDPEAPKSTPPA